MVSVDSVTSRRKRTTVLVVLVLLMSAGVAAGVALTVLEFDPIEPAQGSLEDSSLVIESESLTYSGLNATQLDLTVNNTDTSPHAGDISVRLLDSSGNEEAAYSTTESFNASESKVVSVTLGSGHNVTTFERVEVLIEETS